MERHPKRWLYMVSVVLLILVGVVSLVLGRHPSGHRAVPSPHPPSGRSPTETAVAFARTYLVGEPVGVDLATPVVLAQLSASPGAPALQAEASEQGVHPTVGSVTATVEDSAAGSVGLSVVAQVDPNQPGGSGPITDYLDLLVVDTGAGWRIGDVQV